jgi:hypothetical protein
LAKVIGVFTAIKGKVGNAVFCTNRGVQVMKTRTIPNDPQSSSQLAWRSCFKSIISYFKILVVDFIRPIWNPFAVDPDTGWSNFLSKNLNSMGGTFDPTKLILSSGTLEPIYDLAVSYNTTTGGLVFTYLDTIFNNGHADDTVSFVVYDISTNEVKSLMVDATDRQAGGHADTIISRLTATNLYVYAIVTVGSLSMNNVTAVSNSLYAVCSAP